MEMRRGRAGPGEVLEIPQVTIHPMTEGRAMRHGTTRVRQAVAAAAMGWALAVAGCAEAQTHQTHMRSETTSGHGHRLTVDADGDVRYTDDDRGVSYVAPGARLVIEEVAPGSPGRRVEYRSAGGGVQRTFWRNGEEARPGGADEEWIARSLLVPIRESTRLAPERTARIYRRGGAGAVLEEISQIGSDGTKRAYYTALFRQPLRAGETARVLRDAGSSIGSDGDKAAVLAIPLDRPSLGDEELVALLQAAERIGSDGDKSRLLIHVLDRHGLRDDGVRAAFFRTAEGIGSDGDKSRVLIAALSGGRLGAAGAGDALRAARGIGSDGDKSRVLIAAMADGGLDRGGVAEALRTARTIGSDGDKARVLMSVPAVFLRDRAVMDAFRTALQGIGSDGDRSRVAAWLARSLS
jgi:hypothetical protein